MHREKICFECADDIEEWWNYCPTCGAHLANPPVKSEPKSARAPSPEAEAMAEELRKLLTLTKIELEGTGNEDRNPWKRRIERSEAALTAYRSSQKEGK